jgi:hypothetical protein
MKRIVMGRSGSVQNLDKLIQKLRKYYREVDSGKRVKTKSESESGSGNKLIDLWRNEYKE